MSLLDDMEGTKELFEYIKNLTDEENDKIVRRAANIIQTARICNLEKHYIGPKGNVNGKIKR